jgi:alpha-amylase
VTTCIVPVLAAAIVTAACATTPAPAPRAVTAAQEPPRHQQWSDAVLYFVIVDRFVDGRRDNNVDVDIDEPGHFHGGDLAGLRAHLDEIADLGVTAIWITPVVRNIPHFVTGAGFPDYGYHGYWADDFYQLDERFGTEGELAALVDACHARGIAVLLDVVYNHAGYESRYVEDPKFQSWMRVYGECGDDDLTSCVGGLPDFRTELPEVADYLMNAHLGLAQRVGLDGFRLDTVKHVDHDFWQEHRRRTRAELGDEFFLLGEVWGGDPGVLDPWFEGDEIDAGFDFGFAGSVIGFVQGRGRTIAFSRYLAKRHRTREGYHLAHYLSSHDVPTAPYQLGGNVEQYRLAVALQLTTVGIPVIYYGEEVGRYGGDWPDNRSPMPWGERNVLPGKGVPRDEALRAYFQDLIRIRREHPALSRGAYQELSTEGDLLVFARVDEASGDAVVVAVNRGDEGAAATVTPPASWQGREVRDALADTTPVPRSAAGELTVEVAPRQVRILVTADIKE